MGRIFKHCCICDAVFEQLDRSVPSDTCPDCDDVIFETLLELEDPEEYQRLFGDEQDELEEELEDDGLRS